MSAAAANALDRVLAPLGPEQREHLLSTPRAGRLALYAQFTRDTEVRAVQRLGEVCDLPVAETVELLPKAEERVPLRLMHEYQCVPVKVEDPAALVLATLWPPEPGMDEWVYATCGAQPRWRLAPAKVVVNAITQNFGVGAGSLSGAAAADEDASGREVEEAEDENAALIRFVNDVVQKAVEDRATDIHFEPLKESLQIRYRIDGELVPIRLPDNLVSYQGAILSRLKIMAKLNISEKRRPQDGRIAFRHQGQELDIRISTLPAMYGESVSLRLLNQKSQPLSFEQLGLLPEDQHIIHPVLNLPHGIVLVTGPTGSGKSTSLTAFIREINTPGQRIITVEDPIEYEVPGVNQTQVRPEIGFTFANALRTILRQDPDVIMVGEIRDRETAEIAIRAAQTGHLVLSTLHTNDAAGALTRLIDMEVEPFLIASAVELIVSQRLVRKLCPHCKQPELHPPGYLASSLRALNLDATLDDLEVVTFGPKGCEHCRHLGYRGRIGIFEILRMNDDIHALVIEKEPASVIRRYALDHGMTSLQASGWKQVKLGHTSLAEILTYAKVGVEELED